MNRKRDMWKKGDALINPPDLRQKSDISFFKVQGVNKRFMMVEQLEPRPLAPLGERGAALVGVRRLEQRVGVAELVL